MFTNLRQTDPQIFDAVRSEINRQAQGLELIASENFVSNAVLETMGTPLTNKYAEGYPKNRYYGGCEFHDVVEILAIQRARKLFGVEHANVQPHSGAQANMAVYFGCLDPGDTMMAMDLAHGGHLSHGSPVNSSGRLYNVVHYRVDAETHRIDFDHVRQMAQEHKPKLIVCGASAYPRFVEFEKFREIADEIGAKVMADIAHIAGLVVAKVHPDPVPYCDFITTTTHKTLRGPRGGLILTSKENKRLVNSNLFPGTQGGPLMHMIAAKAVAFQEALQPSFAAYQKKVVENAKALAEALLSQDIPLVSGGTDNHLMMMNVGALGLTGKQCEKALDEAGITVNKNMIPYDPNPPQVASGIRVGTPALTTRGMGADEMRTIADWIRQVFDHVDDEKTKERVRAEVNQLTEQFPLYQDLLGQMKDAPA